MALRIEWSNEQEQFPIGDELITKLKHILEVAGEMEEVMGGEIALSFVDDEEIRRLNNEFRGKDQATDVLSFPLFEEGNEEPVINYEDLEELDAENGISEAFDEEELLGDIVISVPRALAQSEEYGHSAEREIGFLFVHGFLHLIGYDHETSEEDEKIMFARQEEILERAGLPR
ncbi:MAG: rRNA maturation RNase YbeY [Gorillibacterium sp.]|nr:rRNA maturation RNase YbeY [Gorillibacterium sp.]